MLNQTPPPSLQYNAKGATDVTGFGILGHAQNLAESQKAKVVLELHTLPMIAGMAAVSRAHRDDSVFKLLQGYSAETSGGLLMIVAADQAQALVADLQQQQGQPAWVVGKVLEAAPGSDSSARLAASVEILEV